ncbi:hypothetical protein GPUN_1829 [Glaciecola punicea ACAM 611]|uniref:Uncharacterized protein n=1 Tax=Glaciecola punicea ACAM 611 TaxID=1121923 RepID=H5TCB8_9ALTE|nr:hypothetical protein GPUN_1829 [Glaciecola punicea ACAM 611]
MHPSYFFYYRVTHLPLSFQTSFKNNIITVKIKPNIIQV